MTLPIFFFLQIGNV